LIFESITALVASVTGVLAIACFLAIPVCCYSHTKTIEHRIDEGWRDESPGFIRFIRRFFDALTHDSAVSICDQLVSEKEKARIHALLSKAGYSYSIMVGEYVMTKIFGLLAVSVLVSYLSYLYGLSLQQGVMFTLAFGMFGYIYPDFWLGGQIRDRAKKMELQFPFFLDVLILTMRAGLAFSMALEQAVKIVPAGPVKQEFGRAISEIRCGVSRSEALHRLAERVQLPSISNFVAVVSQAEESGGSLTQSLNEQAKTRRRERFQKAEKLAGQAPVKLLVPLFTLIFPILFIIIGVPLYLDLKATGMF